MGDDRLPVAELLAKTGDGDLLRSVAESALQIIREAHVNSLIDAGKSRAQWRALRHRLKRFTQVVSDS